MSGGDPAALSFINNELNSGGFLNDPLGTIGGVVGNPLNTIKDAASAAVSAGQILAKFATFISQRGKFLLLVLAGVAMAGLGAAWLGKDLAVPMLTKGKRKTASASPDKVQ